MLASNGEHTYSHNYSGASSPVIRIENPEYITKFAVNDLIGNLTGFTIDYADVSNADVFTALLWFENAGANKASTTGNPFVEFIDIGAMTLILE